jgi:hypothetical protein
VVGSWCSFEPGVGRTEPSRSFSPGPPGRTTEAVSRRWECGKILREIVEHRTKREAILATRRLCGFRVARLEEFSSDRQDVIRRTCERAWGSVLYWVPEADLPA